MYSIYRSSTIPCTVSLVYPITKDKVQCLEVGSMVGEHRFNGICGVDGGVLARYFVL